MAALEGSAIRGQLTFFPTENMGATSAHDRAALLVAGATFEVSNNEAALGGNVFLASSELSHAVVADGSATSGGGVYATGDSAALSFASAAYTVVVGNTATEVGGGVAAVDVDLRLEYSIVLGNSATEYGGACSGNPSPRPRPARRVMLHMRHRMSP